MAIKFRLQRIGAKKKPHYTIVVTDSRNPRDGKIIEKVGRYNPNTEPSEVVINTERAAHWYKIGARPTEIVDKLFKIVKFQA